MTNIPKVVALPGMDGTGVLLSGFLEASHTHFDVEVVAYPDDRAMTYEELAEYVIAHLPRSGRFFLLGESFGGPLALIIAQKAPTGLAGVILCASFARFPVATLRILAPFARFAPLWFPAPAISWLLLGRWASKPLLDHLLAVLAGLRPSVLRTRIASALRVDALTGLSRMTLPVLLLRATEDRVVPAAAAAAIAGSAPASRLVDVQSPHFMLQSAPNECIALIAAFIREVVP